MYIALLLTLGPKANSATGHSCPVKLPPDTHAGDCCPLFHWSTMEFMSLPNTHRDDCRPMLTTVVLTMIILAVIVDDEWQRKPKTHTYDGFLCYSGPYLTFSLSVNIMSRWVVQNFIRI